MIVSETHVAIGLALCLALAYLGSVIDRARWRRRVTDRFVYGVPWGTAVTVVVLFGFYLVAQHGLDHWDQPLIYPYISWSYGYPTGLLTAGVAHGSPAHVVSNATATLVFGVIAEYTWGHYPPSRTTGAQTPRWKRALSTPWVRALVVFPGVLVAIAVLTAVFSLGPGLGFSGAVYAIVGFTLLTTPRLAVGGVVASSAVSVLYDAVTNPVVTEGLETGPPSPPSWAGVGFQAHLLGFLVGALCAIAVLRRRRVTPAADAVFGGLVLVGLVQSLWLLVLPGEAGTYTLYRGIGVTFLFALAVFTAVAAAGSDRPLPRPARRFDWIPSRRQFAIVWLGTLTIVLGSVVASVLPTGDVSGLTLGIVATGFALLAVPALPPLLPDRVTGGPTSYRGAAVLTLCVITAVVALVAVPYGFTLVDGQPTGTGAVTVDDYTVTYEENASIDRTVLGFPDDTTNTSYGGLLVANDELELFTVGERAAVLEHTGEATVAVGGPGWYETVRAERSGWNVLGNGTAYVVDLAVDGDVTRSYSSGPVGTGVQFTNASVQVAPTDEGFTVRISNDGDTTSVPVPEANASRSVDSFVVRTDTTGEVDRILVSRDGVTVPIAERETY
ncbi:rhomboid family intramembrane serine protease [Halovivax cerinus]|uniref:Rhomboid family intramembrane serine protease n=1 Tax=Halovivax cerinus TaxID=1487865 RepID=A0ABD5NL67_9EURY|nr:rhomboid family intramembrane serine protease [Halovivax cerinus]